MEKTTNEIRLSLETSQRMGKIKGKFIGNTFEMPIGSGTLPFKLALIVFIIEVGSLFCLLMYFKLFRESLSWKFPALCIVAMFVSTVINLFVKKILIFDFNKKKLYTKNTVFGKQCDNKEYIVAFSNIDRFAIDTFASRKKIQYKNDSRDVPLDYNIIKSRNLRAFSKFFHFYSNLVIINKEGKIIEFCPMSDVEKDLKKLTEIGSVLSESFETTITICKKDEKILADNKSNENSNFDSFIKSKTINIDTSLLYYRNRNVYFSEDGKLIVVPIFSEEEYLEMEKEAKENQGIFSKIFN